MKCPYCGFGTSKVLNSRPVNENETIRRRRQCEQCERRFTTYEKVETIPIMIIKRNMTREPFDREKLLKGIVRSCNKRSISIEQIEGLVDEIENAISTMETKEISSTTIGQMTMEHLRNLDEVSYIRFASVYKQFKSIDEFITELENIKKQKQ
ncbi:transcriptional regulator NrdR [Sporanaerobium hydrogeniformans]|uniref:Transcriptional regulator NrdR n=1 Tax=Sporanaerobium hydrogeniformans TaxID=3072179 RepID=A0AC61DCP4_9FIRM|nr:transcriptional regulator NrdR [Sporanaerobium hydrogeniformans]PHV71099.1 transcriptional regulator NrdR [Sporanaerobium hydrogeniformans]